jgi:hypothetical protein
MRVISQDGTIDVPYENFVFSILNSSGGNYGIVAIKNVAEPPEVFINSLIATYSTETKAIKAMEMLRKAWINETVEFTHGIYHRNIVFQFPQDDEIEV